MDFLSLGFFQISDFENAQLPKNSNFSNIRFDWNLSLGGIAFDLLVFKMRKIEPAKILS